MDIINSARSYLFALDRFRSLSWFRLVSFLGSACIALATPPLITQAPLDTAVTQNDPLRLSVTASGTSLAYQWQLEGTNISGATNSVFLRVRPTADNAGHYTVVVSNAEGSLTSDPPAVVSVTPGPNPLAGGFYDSTFPYPTPAAVQDHVVAVSGRPGYMFWGPTTVEQNVRIALLDDERAYRWGSESFWDNPQSINSHYITNSFSSFVRFPTTEIGIVGIASDLSDAYLLGSGNISYQTAFKAAPVTASGSFVSLDGVDAELIALSNEGSVINLASEYSGRQGNTIIPTPRPAIAIAAGPGQPGDLSIAKPGFVVALQDDHSVFVWKYPDGSPTNKTGLALPIPVGLQSGVSAIAADTNGFAGIRKDGSMVYQPLDGSVATTIPAQDGMQLVSGTPAFVLTGDHRGLSWNGHAWQPAADVPHWVQGHLLGKSGTSLLISAGAPWILAGPKDVTVNAGETAWLEVDGGGSGVTYQWFHEGTAVRGATNALLSISGVVVAEQGRYTVVLSNAFGSVTNATPATMAVAEKPAESFELVALDPKVDLPLPMRRGIRQLRVGGSHIVTLGTDGAVRAWIPRGISVDFGQANVPAAAQSGVVNIAASTVSSSAVKDDGSVVFWGYVEGGGRNGFVQTPPARIRKASTEGNYFINADGGVVAWNMTRKMFVTEGIPPAAANGVIQVEGTYALKSDGTVISLTSETFPDDAKSGIVRLGESPGSLRSFIAPIGLKRDGTVISWTQNSTTNYPTKFSGATGLIGDGPTIVTAEGTAVRLAGATGLDTTFIPQDWQGRVIQFSYGFVLLKPEPGFLRFATPLKSDAPLASIPLSAYSLRGLPVQFRVVSGPATVSGSYLFPTGAGQVSVVAEEVNVANPTDTESITRTFNLPFAHQVLSVPRTLPSWLTLAMPALDLTVTASSGLPVSYTVLSGPGYVNGSQLTATNLGFVEVLAEQPGDAFTAPAPSRTLGFLVGKEQHITAAETMPDAIYGGESPVPLSATSDSGLPIGYTVLSGPGVILAAKWLAIVGVGTIQVSANQDGNLDYIPAPSRTITCIARPPLQWKPGSLAGSGTPTLLTRLPLKQTGTLMEGTLSGAWKPFATVTGLGPDSDIEVPLPPGDLSAPVRLWRVDVSP